MITEIPYRLETEPSKEFVVRAVELFDTKTQQSIGFAAMLVKTVGKATEQIMDKENAFHPYIYKTSNPSVICYLSNGVLSCKPTIYSKPDLALAASGHYQEAQ